MMGIAKNMLKYWQAVSISKAHLNWEGSIPSLKVNKSKTFMESKE